MYSNICNRPSRSTSKQLLYIKIQIVKYNDMLYIFINNLFLKIGKVVKY